MRKPNSPGLPFPMIPTRWGEEERRFSLGLRDLLEQTRWQRAYPVGIVVLSAAVNRDNEPARPFPFGEWEQVTTSMTGIYGWRRVR